MNHTLDYTAFSLQNTSDFAKIKEKALGGKRLNFEEGMALFRHPQKEAVFQLADQVREKRQGNQVYFATTLFVHPSNLCELSCPMCSFYAKPGWKTAWFYTPQQIEERLRAHLDQGLTEVHIVGGLWKQCNLDYYQELFLRIKKLDPNLHIKALTAVEYDFLARLHGISVENVFEKMMQWGLGSLPGGGAEVLVESIRRQIAPQKISSKRYLEIHKIAHKLGLHSNITMLFGHIEKEQHLIEHLICVRKMQDETQGFCAFIPLKYHRDNNSLGKREQRLKPKNVPLVYAISRLMLDNIEHIKVLWNYTGLKEAETILKCGANDLASTALEERVIAMAGGLSTKVTHKTLENIIIKQGKIPEHVHSAYRAKINNVHGKN